MHGSKWSSECSSPGEIGEGGGGMRGRALECILDPARMWCSQRLCSRSSEWRVLVLGDCWAAAAA